MLLSKLFLPSTIMSISDNAFKGCTDLKNVKYDSDESDWDKITIGTENTALTDADISFKETERSVVLGEDSVEVTMSGNESAVLVLASYNGEEMVSVRYKKITGGYSQALSETGFTYSAGDTVKAFLWKDMKTIMPLSVSKSLAIR